VVTPWRLLVVVVVTDTVLMPLGHVASVAVPLLSVGTFTQVRIGAPPKFHWKATICGLEAISPRFFITINVPRSGAAAKTTSLAVTGALAFVFSYKAALATDSEAMTACCCVV